MGQTSSQVVQQATGHSSYTAHGAPAGLKHHGMAEQQWILQMEAKRQALLCQFMTFLEEGMQSTFLPLSHPLKGGRRAAYGSWPRLCY